MDICAQGFVRMHVLISHGYVPWSGITGPDGNSGSHRGRNQVLLSQDPPLSSSEVAQYSYRLEDGRSSLLQDCGWNTSSLCAHSAVPGHRGLLFQDQACLPKGERYSSQNGAW